MEPQALEQMHDQRADLNRALAEVRAATKHAKQREKDAKRKAANAWTLPTTLLHTLLIIYSLTGYAVEPCLKFLANSGRKRSWPEKTDEELETMLGDKFLSANLDDLLQLCSEEDPTDPGAMKAALVYVEEWRAVVWTRNLNLQHGLAPSTASVLGHLERNRLRLPAAVRPRSKGNCAQNNARKWIHDWRHRWGGRYSRIKVREDIPLPEMRQKVSRKKEHECDEML
jgi:hypothetical protein